MKLLREGATRAWYLTLHGNAYPRPPFIIPPVSTLYETGYTVWCKSLISCRYWFYNGDLETLEKVSTCYVHENEF